MKPRYRWAKFAGVWAWWHAEDLERRKTSMTVAVRYLTLYPVRR